MKARYRTRTSLGSIDLHNANAIYPSGIKLCIDAGRVFFDIDNLEETQNYKGGDYLHIGISGKWRIEKVSSDEVKGHIDVYIPYSPEKMIKLLNKKDGEKLTEFL